MSKWTKSDWKEYWKRQHEQTLKDLATIKKAEEDRYNEAIHNFGINDPHFAPIKDNTFFTPDANHRTNLD